MMTFGIVIPLHDPNQEFEGYLRELFESVKVQTQLPNQIILGGSSKPLYINSLLAKYQSYFNISFHLNDSHSTSSNLNLLQEINSTTVTKILFQDDFFISNRAIEEIKKYFQDPSTIWLVSSSKNYNDENKTFVRKVVPKMSPKLADGVNSIGSPSVVTYRTKDFLPFDNQLLWLLDCEWYLRMFHNYGAPVILHDYQIASRLHSKQATHTAKKLHYLETQAVKNKHKNYSRILNLLKSRRTLECSCTGNKYEG